MKFGIIVTAAKPWCFDGWPEFSDFLFFTSKWCTTQNGVNNIKYWDPNIHSPTSVDRVLIANGLVQFKCLEVLCYLKVAPLWRIKCIKGGAGRTKKGQLKGRAWGYTTSGSLVQLLSHVRPFATPWTAACQASLSIANSWSSLKLTSIESVMPPNYLILCRPLLLLPSIFPNIRVFSSESVLCIRWPKYWSFSFGISLSAEYSGLVSFRIDRLDLLAVQRTSCLIFKVW